MTALSLLLASVLIVNADNDHYFCQGGRGTNEMTVAAMRAYVDEIASGGKVTHLFLCPQGQRASYDSKVWEPIWLGADGATPDEGMRDRWCANAKLCHDRGIDPYAVWIARARERKISPWISMRMNDIHGVTTRNHFRVTGFWRDHPELRRCTDRDPYTAGSSWGPFAFDYAHKEVRDYHLKMVKELIDRYDADGLELDWMRFPFVLREGHEREDAHFITDFMREVRAYARGAEKRRGHAYRISVRMPPRFKSAQGFGFDVDVWAKEGLVDMVSPCNFIQSYDFRMDIAEWRRVMGAANPSVRIVPGGANMCGCNSWDGTVSLPFEVWKGWCDVAFSRGAEGVYLFNADYLASDVKRRVYREGIDAKSAARGARRYLASFDDCPAGPDASMGLRCPFKAAEKQEIVIPVGTVRPEEDVSVIVAYSGKVEPPEVTLNGVASEGAPIALADMRPYCAKFAKAACRWRFPSTALKAGDNIVGIGAAAAEKAVEGVWCEIAVGPVRADVPRPEYPRPQFERAAWVNLNGPWTYTFDFGQSGLHAGRQLFKSKGFDKTILVPFCPESKLSGVGYTDFIPAMWYHRKLAIPAEWKGRRIVLNFGGVDYESEIFIDGVSAGLHYGGSASFSVDLTLYVSAGKTHDLVLRVKDATGDGQPCGKQCAVYKSQGCHYTRTTGIWQTVWMEAIDPAGLASCRIVPDLDGGAFVFTPVFLSDRARTLRITVKTADGQLAGAAEAKAVNGVAVVVPLKVVKTWSPEDPHLYDIAYETLDAAGKVTDAVTAYAGLRKVSVENGRVCLNGKPYYLRFVLDQGFYPDGVWTAPTDAALKKDIELSMAAGFNGARLHQKVFEERFHYWADRLGYLTWGEMSSWGSDPTDITAARNFIPEWCEVVRRDLNHPSIIAWTPYNETWSLSDPNQHQRTQNDVYELTKAIDPTRPVNGSSGDFHAKTDLWTIHCYDRAPQLGAIDKPEGSVFCPDWLRKQKGADRLPYWRYDGQPYLIDEFGGLGWVPPERRAADNTWGYGNAIKTEEEFFSVLKAEVDQIKAVKRICGYCYTQLTDVEQEQNGVYYYDRTPKFDPARFRAIFGQP